MFQIGYVYLFSSALCSAIASVLLKYPDKVGLLSISSNTILIKLPAIAFYGAGFILYSLGLKDIDVSKAYPVMVTFAMLMVLILGFSFGEEVSTRTISGMLFLIFGIIIISYK